MLCSTLIFDISNRKITRKRSNLKLLRLFLTAVFSSDFYQFLTISDKFHQLFFQRISFANTCMLNAIKNVNFNRVIFDTDSFLIVIDSSASSFATSFKTDYIARTCKELEGVVISGIASGLEAKGIGSVLYKIKDNDGIPIHLQVDKVLHLENLPTRIISP